MCFYDKINNDKLVNAVKEIVNGRDIEESVFVGR